MNIVIGANYKDISKIQNLFRNFTRIKGTFPLIKNCYNFINEKKYIYDDSNNTGGINPEYPHNVIYDIRQFLKKYDIVIVPIDNKLLKHLRKNKKIDRVCIYEELDDSVESDVFRELSMSYLKGD